jgi:hypothetical protein
VQYAQRVWPALRQQYEEYQAAERDLDERWEWVRGDEHAARRWRLRRYRLRRKYRPVRQLFEEDYPQFQEAQAYAGTTGDEVFVEIFLTDTAYVVLSRLLFVRLCEDLGFLPHKVTNRGLRVWRDFVGTIRHRYQDLLELAFKDAAGIYTSLFEETAFEWYRGCNDDLSALLERILFRLNAFDFRRVDRDVLGSVYQRFLPPKKRKRLGEFYTDQEIVDFILWRAGLADDPDLASKRVLDPACGSFTFGVRTANLVLERTAHLGPAHQIEAVRDVLIGVDINPFAAFIAHLSLLFTALEQYKAAKDAAPGYHLPPFQVECENSLIGAALAASEGGAGEESNGWRGRRGPFDYVVGNPPYVRNERLPEPDREALRHVFGSLYQRNTDLSIFFVRIALGGWLRQGGSLGFVLSLGLANSDAATPFRRLVNEAGGLDLASLEWMATEVFQGTDIVPMLLFARQEPRRSDDQVTLVQGLRSKEDLHRFACDPAFRDQHTALLPRQRWERLSPAGDWCLEVSADDLPVLEQMRSCPTIGRTGVARATYGIKRGATAAAAKAVVPMHEAVHPSGWLPFCKGNDVAMWAMSDPTDAIIREGLADVDNPSLWRSLLDAPGSPAGPEEVVAFPVIYVTLSAAVLNVASTATNDSVILCVPGKHTAHTLAAVINSLPSRYYAFLVLRAAILLRRRSHFYPRTIDNLPWPALSEPEYDRLDELSRLAHDLSAEVHADEVDRWARRALEVTDAHKAAFLLRNVTWPEDLALGAADLISARVGEGRLWAGQHQLAEGDDATLLLLLWSMRACGCVPLTRQFALDLLLPRQADERQGFVRDIQAEVSRRGDRLKQLEAAQEEMDDLVTAGLGLGAEQRAYLRRRCHEFPLSDTVMRPRYLWSEDRKKQPLRRYDLGQRFR